MNGVYIPRKVVQVLSLKKDGAAIARLGYPLKESLYLCAGNKCFAEVTDPEKVEAEVKRYIESLKEEKS